MQEIKPNKYFDKPIEEVVECLKKYKQKLVVLKQKQKYLMENDPNNKKLKNSYEREWNAVLVEIKEINDYNEYMKRMNEKTDDKVDTNKHSYDRRESEAPTIDEIKDLLTDNSQSEDDLHHSNSKSQNEYRKYIHEKYQDILSRNQPSNYSNPQINKLMERNNKLDLTKGNHFLEDYDENGHPIINNKNKNRNGKGRNDNILRDLDDIKEINKAIQRANLTEDYDDLEILKSRNRHRLPPTPPTTGVVKATRDSPMNYEFVDKFPSNNMSHHRMYSYDTNSDSGYGNNTPPIRDHNGPYNRNPLMGGFDYSPMENNPHNMNNYSPHNDAGYFPSPGPGMLS